MAFPAEGVGMSAAWRNLARKAGGAVAPDGSAYVLHTRAGGSADNINQTYTVNLSTEVRNGTWRLRVRDAASLDIGRIDGWTLTL